jgi:hypothetical protein
MLRIRISLAVLALSLGINGAGASGCGTKRNEAPQDKKQTENKNVPVKPENEEAAESVNDEIKTLAEGNYGKVTGAFVAVARDLETYAALRELAENLPRLNADFFKQNIVVGAFLGQRPTGGYGVQITRTKDNRLRVAAKSPPAGSMTTQALTAPFKIVSVQATNERPVAVEIDAAWNSEMRPYRVGSGEFTTGGGFAGRIEKLKLAGDIRVSRLGRMATFVFDLQGSGAAKPRALQDAATGIVAANGSIGGAIVDAGSLVDFPRSALVIKGNFTGNEEKLSLSFESLPSNVSDGYSGQGKLEATATAPPLPKKTSSDDAPM